MADGDDAEREQVLETVRAIFSAISENDEALFNTVIAPDFYLFEAGVRFDGPGMLALIKAERDAGKSFEWNVTEPDIRIGGNVACIAYVNSPRDVSNVKSDLLFDILQHLQDAQLPLSKPQDMVVRTLGPPGKDSSTGPFQES